GDGRPARRWERSGPRHLPPGLLLAPGRSRKSRLWSGPSQEVPPAEQAPGWGGKRSIVVADDAAFREQSKMLTAMERQKWLNSYMQKLLVVNPD
uniref:Tuberoinfundibular peptide of 39 residues n=1 Tax=Terrapene triunguis TaxID=2587831 RepID=A0A674JSY0_9SAUR